MPAADTSAARREGRRVPARLRITEIFLSLQGETSRVGLPTIFVRLTGCPLRCGYCDTAYAFNGGETLPLADVLARVDTLAGEPPKRAVDQVTVTGGEPLAQPAVHPLLTALCDGGYAVSLETGGALDVARVDPRVKKVVDLKTPGSGECGRNLYANLALLRGQDEVKFVICDRADYEWSRAQLAAHALAARCAVLFSPAAGQLAPATLADWVLADRLPVRFQLQLHKVLWGDARGR